MSTLVKRIERLETAFPSLNQEIACLLKQLSSLSGETEAEIIGRFIQEQEQ